MSEKLLGLIESRRAQVSVIGCGYVGLPLALTLWRTGFRVFAVDIDRQKVESLRACRPYVWGVGQSELKQALSSGDFVPTGYTDEAAKSDVVLLCLPTPLDENNIPDLTAVRQTAEWLARHLRREQLVVLESTTYPGTTEEVVRPILEGSGLTAGEDFYLAYAPHRYDPGSEGRRIGDIPRVVGGVGEASLDVAAAFYETFTPKVVRVSNTQTAEAVKMLENIFRAVNIALVNELKEVFLKLGVDTYEAIEAAATKPFGFMKFLPGPGFGGHCVPVDPFYLAWRAKQVGLECDFVELAGRINRQLAGRIVWRILTECAKRGIKPSDTPFVIVGVAYKPNIADTRESPAFPIMRLLKSVGASVSYYDPLVPRLPKLRLYPEFAGMVSTELDGLSEKALVIVSDHDAVDYESLTEARVVFDTRFAMRRRGIFGATIVEV